MEFVASKEIGRVQQNDTLFLFTSIPEYGILSNIKYLNRTFSFSDDSSKDTTQCAVL